MVYYNEFNPKMAAWLRELIKAGLIAKGFVQCHFFAGLGGWSLALRLAGWDDDRPVWTGSCPCQPFSVASCAHGGAQGQSDERHLWPAFFSLIRERKPPTVFGEQVASAVQWGWWDHAALDLEGIAYACAAAVLRADALGAKHERKRLYWVADSGSQGRQRHIQIDRLSEPEKTAQPINGDAFIRARRALDGDYSDLLPCDGLSVVMERSALEGYGNAIVPPVAATFIQAFLDAQKS